MVFGAWEFAHEEDMFRYFNQALKSLRLYSKDRQRGMVESLICYLNNVMKRKEVEEALEEKCRELAGVLRDTLQGNQIEVSIPIAPKLLEKKATKKRRNRLSLNWIVCLGNTRNVNVHLQTRTHVDCFHEPLPTVDGAGRRCNYTWNGRGPDELSRVDALYQFVLQGMEETHTYNGYVGFIRRLDIPLGCGLRSNQSTNSTTETEETVE